MCLLIIAHCVVPDYPLIVTANRDEFHARATEPSCFWQDFPQVLAGRDLELGGTWMGFTRTGRFAAITNFRDPARTATAPRSRGELPLDYLSGDAGAEIFLQHVARRSGEYAGFNLLVGAPGELWYFSNAAGRPSGRAKRLGPGIYGLSNDQLDTPWPKVTLGKAKMQSVLTALPPQHDRLTDIVADRRTSAPNALKQQGLSGVMEPLLSAQFIVNERYGTRSNTTLWTDSSNRAHWRELSFDNAGETQGLQETTFHYEPAS